MAIEGWMAVFYWAIALVASGLYGWKAVAIFLPPLGEGSRQLPRAWWWHQRWLNFLGGLVG